MKKPRMATNSIYHIYNRGVEKRKIFLDKDDHFRFIHDLYEFNDEAAAPHLYYKHLPTKSSEVEPPKISKRKLLVEIIAYCLMPNHYHLLVRQTQEKGIVRFMQKLGTGYTMYFNQKYQRVGGLFQGRFKAAAVTTDRHFLYLPHYIHLNPLDLVMPKWREQKIEDPKKALQFLESYQWSSYLDYTGKKNFPSLLSKKLFEQFYGSSAEYHASLTRWIKDMQLDDFGNITLEK